MEKWSNTNCVWACHSDAMMIININNKKFSLKIKRKTKQLPSGVSELLT